MSSCEEGRLAMGLDSVGILQVALFLRCVSNLRNFSCTGGMSSWQSCSCYSKSFVIGSSCSPHHTPHPTLWEMTLSQKGQVVLVNPRRACGARVTVLGLCVCVYVCLLLNISLFT